MAQCSECTSSYNPYATEPTIIGYGEQVNREFARYRKHFDLCERCLISKIQSDIAAAQAEKEESPAE